MTKKQKRYGFGSWCSPITASLVAKKSIKFGDVAVDGDDIYWVESRPAEKGRSVVVQHSSDCRTHDVIQDPFSARSRVHEYGGGAFTVHKQTIYFTNFDDQQVYRMDRGSDPAAITHSNDKRYADFVVDERRGRIICIQESHSRISKESVNAIVAIDVEGKKEPQILVSGNDFYASPRISPDGESFAWLTWNHPNMPWDGTELWAAYIGHDGSIDDAEKIAGDVSESIFQPEWSPDGSLYFVSDKNGWWNLYRKATDGVEIINKMDAEFGVPQWTFGLSTYGFMGPGGLVCVFNKNGIWYLATIDLETKKLTKMDVPWTDITHLKTVDKCVVFQGGSPTEGMSVIRYEPSSGDYSILQQSTTTKIDAGYLSQPEVIEFNTTNDLTACGFYYPPHNIDYTKPSGELPPLIVVSHGGPTGCSYNSLDLKKQFWTSRGFAVFDVNYGGSTGFGRPYRERLKRKWGIVDVDDCINGALYLVDRSLVDVNRLIIRGGSAGGYTTLAALTFHDVFKAGASYYGVSDLEALTRETHKFESQYLDSLIGPYPKEMQTYKARSAINHAEHLKAPIIFFQGLEDKVVLANQAEKMVAVLRNKGIPVAYLAFDGEQHGFRKAENIRRSLEAELYFYAQVFGFTLSEDIAPVAIDNI
ncbi:S9 family peptidase [candidate division WOR-3 bacterium]|nr:S9 family peptidase [candidate division WOR-3 bacterium]